MSGKQGFASMPPERRSEIARKGGIAAHAKGTAHEWTSEEARAAGQKGGRVVSADVEHMAAIGTIGGSRRHLGSKAAVDEIDSLAHDARPRRLENAEV